MEHSLTYIIYKYLCVHAYVCVVWTYLVLCKYIKNHTYISLQVHGQKHVLLASLSLLLHSLFLINKDWTGRWDGILPLDEVPDTNTFNHFLQQARIQYTYSKNQYHMSVYVHVFVSICTSTYIYLITDIYRDSVQRKTHIYMFTSVCTCVCARL